MRILTAAIHFLVLTSCAFAQDVAATIAMHEERAKLVQSERAKLINCLSEVVDRSRAQSLSKAEFDNIFPKSCPEQFSALQRAFLERIIPLIEQERPTPKLDDQKREELATLGARMVLIPMANEFSRHTPFRYRLKDIEEKKTPTTEDLALAAAKEAYMTCLSKFSGSAKASGVPADEFKASLENACLAESDRVRQAERTLWETYASPPPKPELAGRRLIQTLKIATLRSYTK